MSKWINVKDQKPRCSYKPDSFGTPVLIWPHYKSEGASDVPYAFYGRRQSDKPNFYIYGRIIDVKHWQYLPDGPSGENL